MKKLFSISLALFIAANLMIAGCSEESGGTEIPDPGTNPGNNDPNNNSGGNSNPSPSDWLIPSSQVFDGGPGKDGIPSIDNPQFSSVNEISFLDPDDLVIGVKVGDEIKAYPHPIMDWHEIVNDNVGNLPLAITYCPLTGTAIGWEREVNGVLSTFGVSGLLYNTNLIPYDRATDSNWSQMLLKSVNGERIGTEIVTYPVVETTWETWQALFPDSKVLNLNTGFSRAYSRFPYGDYRTNDDFLLFPITNDDGRLPRKDRGLGVIVDGGTKFYHFDSFASAEVVVANDMINGVEVVVAGSQEQNFLVAYKSRLANGTLLEFSAIEQTSSAEVMTDQEGNRWNVFGEAVSGPRAGQRLEPTDSYIGYWFSWGAFYPDIEIYQN